MVTGLLSVPTFDCRFGGGGDGDGGGGLARAPQSVQSLPRSQAVNSAPGPPSSHSPSEVKEHLLKSSSHCVGVLTPEPWAAADGGSDDGALEGGALAGGLSRDAPPEGVPLVGEVASGEGGTTLAGEGVRDGGGVGVRDGGGVGVDEAAPREPQSAQSVALAQEVNSAPGPPSSQSPSEE